MSEKEQTSSQKLFNMKLAMNQKELSSSQKLFNMRLGKLLLIAGETNQDLADILASLVISTKAEKLIDALLKLTPDERVVNLVNRYRPQFYEEVINIYDKVLTENSDILSIGKKTINKALRAEEARAKVLAEKARPAARKKRKENAEAAHNGIKKAIKDLFMTKGQPRFEKIEWDWLNKPKTLIECLRKREIGTGYKATTLYDLVKTELKIYQKIKSEYDCTQKPKN